MKLLLFKKIKLYLFCKKLKRSFALSFHLEIPLKNCNTFLWREMFFAEKISFQKRIFLRGISSPINKARLVQTVAVPLVVYWVGVFLIWWIGDLYNVCIPMRNLYCCVFGYNGLKSSFMVTQFPQLCNKKAMKAWMFQGFKLVTSIWGSETESDNNARLGTG